MSHRGKVIDSEDPGVQTELGFQHIINDEKWLQHFLRVPQKRDLQ